MNIFSKNCLANPYSAYICSETVEVGVLSGLLQVIFPLLVFCTLGLYSFLVTRNKCVTARRKLKDRRNAHVKEFSVVRLNV